MGLTFIHDGDLEKWSTSPDISLTNLAESIGANTSTRKSLVETLGLREHIAFIAERGSRDDVDLSLDSISFHSLCCGFFLPLSMMHADRALRVLGIPTAAPLDSDGRTRLVADFFERDIGLTRTQKLGCVLGDVFFGQKSTFRRDSMLRLLMGATLLSRRDLLDQLAYVGDIALLFAGHRAAVVPEEPLTALEVLYTLSYLPSERRAARYEVLRSLYSRMSKVEAYFFAKLLLRKTTSGLNDQSPSVTRALSTAFQVEQEAVEAAVSLTDSFRVLEVLEEDGTAGLHKIRLQPLLPVRPALCGTKKVSEIDRYPVWVERKYDGIRIMGHKSTGSYGSILCGAYTRRRLDWLELLPGFQQTMQCLPANSCICDGEIHGTIMDGHRVRPATVYELYAYMTGEKVARVQLRYSIFDLLFLNGEDLTARPLRERRTMLTQLVSPMAQLPYLPIPVGVSDGQMAQNQEDIGRLYTHFRNQGYEGVVVKDWQGTYALGRRDGAWYKRKPELTLDLVLMGAVFAVTSKTSAGMFGSYVIGARDPSTGEYIDVGDVAGIDQVRDADIQATIMREGLLTGRRIERVSASGTRGGVELRPHIVVAVRFEGLTREVSTGKLKLRGPKLAFIRADKDATEADAPSELDKLYLRQQMV